MNDKVKPVTTAFHGGAFFEDIGPDFSDLDRRRQVINADVVDAWYDPSPRVVAKLSECLSWLVRTSPPVHAEGLLETIAEVRGVPTEHLVVGGGSSDLMYLAFPNLVKPGARVVILDPMYGEYSHILGRVLPVSTQRSFQSKQNGFAIDLDTLVRDAKGADLVVLVNPNNPTGAHVGSDFVAELLAALSRDTLLFIDETYTDYVPGSSVETWVPRHDNLVVLKSMSKIYALSGARAAYLAASRAIIERLRLHSPPWSVSLLGQVAAVEALKDAPYYRERIAETHRLRDAMSQELGRVPGLSPFDSVANFILMELTNPQITASAVYQRMRARNVHVRNCDSQSLAFGGRFVRTAVKDPATNQKIVAAFRSVMRELEAGRVEELSPLAGPAE